MFPELTRDDVFRIETKRLWLRWFRHQDAQAVARMASDPDVAEMTATIPHPYPDGTAEQFIFEARKANATGQKLVLAIAPRGRPDQVLGTIGSRQGPNGLTMGYWLGQPHWGKGFATEAAQAYIDAVFTITDLSAIHVSARVINPASRHVIEKCGFQFTGSELAGAPARGGPVAVDCFRLSRSTWSSLKTWRAPFVHKESARAGGEAPALCA